MRRYLLLLALLVCALGARAQQAPFPGQPGGVNGQSQCNTLGVMGACPDLFDIGSVVTVNNALKVGGDSQFFGPNPYVDVRAFGVRMVSSVPSTTATISGTSTSAALASASTFQNGDGITIYGAGANNPVTTPGTPTVASSLSASSLRVGNVVAANAGSTTYNYQIACQDKLGALTAASSVGTTTTGLANLGAVSVNITSLTRSNNSVAVVTSSANDLVVGAAVYIQSVTDTSFDGPHVVATRTDSTHCTYLQAISTTLGASSSSTGGTATWYTSNHITWTMPTNGWKCWVYGRSGGSLTLIGVAKPLETFFDDYGATTVFNGESIMGAPYTPAYIPNTPPSSATNDPLVTTIISGAGTTSLTLANAATNSVSGATATYDDGLNLKTAVTSAGPIPVYIPSSGGSLVINSYTVLPGPATIWQAGKVTLNETLELGGSSTWLGDMGGTPATAIQFSWNQSRTVTTNAAPGIYLPTAGTRARGLAFTSNFDQALNVLAEGGFESEFEWCQFQTGIAANQFDALGIGYEERGAVNTTFYFTLFDSLFNNSTGPLGLWAPSLLHTGNASGPGAYLNLHNTMIVPKGITFDLSNATSTNDGSIDQVYSQGLRTPMLLFSQTFGGGLASNWRLSNIEEDTSFAPLVTNLSLSLNTIEIRNIGGENGPLLTGNPVTNLTSNAQSLQPYLGATGSQVFDDAKMTVYGPGTFQSGMLITQTAPGLSLSAGGTLSTSAHTYTVQFLDINGNGSAVTPVASITPTTGNQTVVVTPAAFPSGSVTWIIIRDGQPIQFPACVSPIAVSVTSFSDTGFATCGNVSLSVSAGTSVVGPLGISTPVLSTLNNGFTSTFDFPSTLTANRNIHVPNATGTLAFKDLAQTWTATQTLNNASQVRFLSTNGTNYAGFQGGASTSNLVWLLPAADSTGTQCLASNGSLQFSFTACSGGTGTPGGANTQVQYNNSGSFGGSTNLTWISPALSIGSASGATGQLKQLGTTSGTVTIQPQDAAGTWTFKWPATGGTSGFPLTTDGTGVSTWSLLGFAGGGTNQTSFTANQLVTDTSGSLVSLAGTLTGANPILTLTAGSASAVPLTLNTAPTPTGDIFDLQINGTKTSFFDNGAFLHVPQVTFNGTNALVLSGTEGTCPTPQVGVDIFCVGNSATHTIQSSLNGTTYHDNALFSNSGPAAHGVCLVGLAFPQLNCTSAGTLGQAFISGGGSADGSFGTLGAVGGGTGNATNTAHGVLVGEGTSAVAFAGPDSISNQPLLSAGASADPAFGALPLGNTNSVSGILTVANGGTGAATLAGASIVTVTGSITPGDCAKWSASTVITDFGAGCGGAGGSPPLNTITGATGSNTINNGVNPQIWNWALTGSTTAFKFGENTAATGSSNILLQASTLSTSTALPFQADSNGNGIKVTIAGLVTKIGTGALDAASLSGAITNGVTATTQAAGDSTADVATDSFVTTAVNNAIAAVNPAVAVQAATTSSSDLSGYTYSNGASGIGATLTAGSNNVALTLDGFTFTAVGQRALVKDFTTSADNGVYNVTQIQTSLLPVILTRALDYDQPSDINNTGAIPVVNGTLNANTSWLLTSAVNTVGTDSLTYVQFSLAPTSIVTAQSSASAAKQVAVSAGASKALNYIDFPQSIYVPAADCVNGVAGSAWSTSSTPAALCRAGTNNKSALLSPWGSSDVGYFQVHLPKDWDTGSNPFIMLELTSTDATNAHTIIMQESVACAKLDGSTTDDVAFNAARSFTTITLNGNANRTWETDLALNSTDMTGCSAPGIMWIKISRTTDTATNVGVYGATVTIPHLITVQAN